MNPDRWNIISVTSGNRSRRLRRKVGGSAILSKQPCCRDGLRAHGKNRIARFAPDPESNSLRRISAREFTPLIGPVLRNRRLCCLLLAVWLVQVALVYIGFSVWSCPVRSALGIACPGCGLTRAVVCLLQGHCLMALELHPLAPAALVIPLLLLPGIAGSNPLSRKVFEALESTERRIPITGLFLTGLLLHWALALVAVPEAGLSG